MSPEQAHGKPVTKASDIYSFGVIAQEILTGVAFYDADSSGDLTEQVKNAQLINKELIPKKYQSFLQELTQKNPNQRPIASEVSAMLHEIIEKPKRRLKKILISALLILAIASFGKYTYDLNQQKNKAEIAKVVAEKAKDESDQISTFLESLFLVSDPYSSQGKEITARQILDDGAKRISQELKNQPHTLVRIKMIIGTIYRKLGLYPSARKQFEDAFEVFEAKYLEDPELQINLLGLMVELEFDVTNYQRMEQLAKIAMRMAQQHHLTDKAYFLSLRFNLAAAYDEQGKHETALEIFKELLQIYNKNPLENKMGLVTTYNYIGLISADASEPEAAIASLEKGLTLLSPNADEDIEYKTALYGNLATIYADQGLYDKAIEQGFKVAKIRQQVLGDEHILLALTYDNISKSYLSLNNITKALEYNTKALNIYEKTNNSNNADYAKTLGSKAAILDKNPEKYKDAELYWIKSLEIFKQAYGEKHKFIADHLMSLGLNYINQKKFKLALEKTQVAIAMYDELGKPMQGKVIEAWQSLIYIFSKNNNIELEISTYKSMLKKLELENQQDLELITTIKDKIKSLVKNPTQLKTPTT